MLDKLLDKAKELYLPVAISIIAVVNGAVGLMTLTIKDNTTATTANTQNLLDAQRQANAEKESTRNLDLALYDRVKDAVTRDKLNTAEGRALLTLINSLADGAFKTGLGEIVHDSAGDPALKREAALTVFTSESGTPAPAPAVAAAPADTGTHAGWGSWNIDLFWCESSGDSAKLLATEALDLRDSSAFGRWRVRMLPAAINAQTGYGVSGFQVRAEAASADPNEEAMGKQLQASLNELFKGRLAEFNIYHPNNRTPNYISAFFCPAQEKAH